MLDLRRMPVTGDPVGVNALGYLAEEAALAGRAAGAADPGFGVDDDVVGVDQPRPQQRYERQLRRSRIAAGNGDQARPPNRVALISVRP